MQNLGGNKFAITHPGTQEQLRIEQKSGLFFMSHPFITCKSFYDVNPTYEGSFVNALATVEAAAELVKKYEGREKERTVQEDCEEISYALSEPKKEGRAGGRFDIGFENGFVPNFPTYEFFALVLIEEGAKRPLVYCSGSDMERPRYRGFKKRKGRAAEIQELVNDCAGKIKEQLFP